MQMNRMIVAVLFTLAPMVLGAQTLDFTQKQDQLRLQAEHVEAHLREFTDLPRALGTDASLTGITAEELRALYAARNHEPMWQDSDALEQLRVALDDLIDDGLDPAEYRIKIRDPRRAGDLDTLLDAEIQATMAYMTALLHVSMGRLEPSSFEPIWRLSEQQLHARHRQELWELAARPADPVSTTFMLARPPVQGYHDLRSAHAQMRQTPPSAWPPVADGPLLRPGMTDPRVPSLRQRLGAQPGLEPPASFSGEHYDADLEHTVRAFQELHGLSPDGVIGPMTLEALNVSLQDRILQVRINMERIRWLYPEHEQRYVLVDVAGARVHFIDDGKVAWSSRVQVGRSARPTPALKSAITHLTLNPTWTVPPTIFNEDMLPKIQRDIRYLEKNQIRVLTPQGQEIPAESVDWARPGPILLRQDAGPANPLGQIVFRFRNPFLVFLHDTPSRGIFASSQRGVSSGCVRVEHAMELARLLLGDVDEATRAEFEARLASGQTHDWNLKRPVTVLLAYWTASSEAGRLSFRPDLYGRDPRLMAAIEVNDGPVLGCR